MSMKVRHNVELAELIQIPGMGFANELSVTFNPPLPHPDVPAGDTAVMVYTGTDGQKCFFICSGFTIPGHGFILYKDTFRCSWPTPMGTRMANYKEFLEIFFRDRPPIYHFVGPATCVLGHLIIMMKSLTRGTY